MNDRQKSLVSKIMIFKDNQRLKVKKEVVVLYFILNDMFYFFILVIYMIFGYKSEIYYILMYKSLGKLFFVVQENIWVFLIKGRGEKDK